MRAGGVMRLAAAPALLVLGGVPLLVAPAASVAWPAGVAVLLCAAGLVGHGRGLVRGGCLCGLGAFALALWESATPAGPASLLAGIGLGCALVVLVEAAGMARLLHRVHVRPSALRSVMQRWLVHAAVTFVLVALLQAASRALPPAPWPAAVAAGGAILSFVAVLWGWKRRYGPR